MSSPVDPLTLTSCLFREDYLPAADDVHLRVRHWKPLEATGKAPLIFVAGWVSAVQGWAEMLREMAPTREVFYIETREKASARFPSQTLTPDNFRIETLARDLQTLVAHLPVDPAACVVSGSSLGATTMLEAMKHGGIVPRAGFFIGPNYRFKAPWFAPLLFKLPLASYRLVARFVLWYLRTFRVDAAREPEQMARYEATILGADPLRIKCSARAFSGYCVAEGLSSITVPVGVAYAHSDTLHAADDITHLVEALPRGIALPCASNKYLHGPAVETELQNFLDRLDTP